MRRYACCSSGRIKGRWLVIHALECPFHMPAMLDEAQWRVLQTADYICGRGFSVVTLQFPDEQLEYAARVATAVQATCASRGHVMQVNVVIISRPPRPAGLLGVLGRP